MDFTQTQFLDEFHTGLWHLSLYKFTTKPKHVIFFILSRIESVRLS